MRILVAALLANAALSQPLGADKVAPVVADRFVPATPEGQRHWGLLGDRMKVNLEKRLLKVDEEGILAGFEKRPGKQAWIGEHAGKFLDAAAQAYRYDKNQQLMTLMKRVATRLLATQLPDGYLGTYEEKDRWTSWDVWVHKYSILGLLSYWRVTGDDRALAGATRAGLLLTQVFGPGKRDIIAASTHRGMAATSVLEPMVLLYRATGNEKFLAFANYLADAWEQENGPQLLSSLLSHGRVDQTANAKAYEMMSDLVGALELYRSTGDERLLRAAVNAQRDIAAHRLYVTGSTSSHEHFHGDGELLGEEGCDAAEGCATVTWLQLNWHLLRLTGDPRYAAQLERTVYNHLLAAQDPSNGNICYFTPLNGRKNASPGISCCVSSEPRGIALIPQLMGGTMGGGGAAMLQYGPGSLTLGGRRFETETKYPLDAAIRITLGQGEGRFPLWLRVPEWASSFTAKAGGREYRGRAGDFLVIHRKWSTGDTVEIQLPVAPHFVDGGQASYPGFHAIQRGPVVYALERSLNAGAPHLHLAGLGPSNEIRPGAKDELEIDGAAVVAGALKPMTLRFVPFHSAKDYRVWIPGRDRLKPQPVAITAFGKETVSAAAPGELGSISDERVETERRAVSRNGQPASFAVEIAEAKPVRRIVFRYGESGRFEGAPAVEIRREPKGAWESAGTLNANGELALAQPVHVTGIRVSGKPAGPFVSCAELGAFE